MQFTKRAMLAGVLASASWMALPNAASAQTALPPNIRIVVGFAAGTAPDTLARILSNGLQKSTGQTVIVENMAGAGGQIAAGRVAKSPADGTTLLLGELGSLAIAPSAFQNLPYDASKDFVAISEIAESNFVLVVPAKAPHKTVAEFVAAAKTQPSAIMATFGVATPGHIVAELLAQTGGFKLEPVHYRAVGDAVTDLGNAQTSGAFVSVPLANANLQSGLIRALAQTGSKRAESLSQVSTVREQGMPELEMSSWFALLAAAGTPAALVEALNKASIEALRDPASAERLSGAGFTAKGTSAKDANAMMASELKRWKGVIDKAGIRVTN